MQIRPLFKEKKSISHFLTYDISVIRIKIKILLKTILN